jgi:hypothetical protein
MAKKKNDARQMVTVANVNIPGYSHQVDALKYAAMKTALLAVLPTAPPGLTQAEIRGAVLVHLPDTEFPKGATAGWWAKTVQLDLEAKRIVLRDRDAKPLRWHRAK